MFTMRAQWAGALYRARSVEEDPRAAVSHQQVRSARDNYPVDRYLVESSKTIEKVSIIDNDIWNPEPMMRPEDELILRKLHDMLRTTADDLKTLSGELAKHHEPGDRLVNSLPTPLDEEYNERIRIQEIVNAKFHGYKLVNSTPSAPKILQKDLLKEAIEANASKSKTKLVDTSVQVKFTPTLKKQTVKKKLGISRTETLQIDGKPKDEIKSSFKQNRTLRNSLSSVAYNELTHHVEPKITTSSSQKALQIQEMPSINIRSELTTQKVLQLDIYPDTEEIPSHARQNNALVVTMQHEPEPTLRCDRKNTFVHVPRTSTATQQIYDQPTVRKVSKMSPHESGDSTNNINTYLRRREARRRQVQTTPETETDAQEKSKNNNLKKASRRRDTRLDQWKTKLNAVYGKTKGAYKAKKPQACDKNVANESVSPRGSLKTEYIPYSKLTLGGVNVRDIEKKICNVPDKNIIISPILDKILSRENSFHNESPRVIKTNKILTSSDENLLQEVIDIESQVTSTLSKEINTQKSENGENIAKDNMDSDVYEEDFEDKTEEERSEANEPASAQEQASNNKTKDEELNNSDETSHNKTYTKTINLSFKSSVDVLEYVHSVDTQDIGTQSNGSGKIAPKETQTSPRTARADLRPIHNDLWPTIDPHNEVGRLFDLEKDFIKKVILEEYSDLFTKNTNNPSTSRREPDDDRNTAASTKITQTSPTHVKSVMTSPTRTKTRTTSPFALSLKVDQHTSPLAVVCREEHLKLQMGDEELDISVNLSSPRFSLRLPRPSTESLPNTERNEKEPEKIYAKKNIPSSSSSAIEDYSSDVSSFGEISHKFKRRLRKSRIPSISEMSSASSMSSRSSAAPPLRSEGELSLGQIIKRKGKNSRSEGEMSLGRL
nr:uncharacterized protein LOC116770751 isoform X2 [Danaus plexippus plexippus]